MANTNDFPKALHNSLFDRFHNTYKQFVLPDARLIAEAEELKRLMDLSGYTDSLEKTSMGPYGEMLDLIVKAEDLVGKARAGVSDAFEYAIAQQLISEDD